MPEILTITPDEFQEAIPRYVERAYNLATLIIERALVDPRRAIELRATVFNATGPGYRGLTSDPVRLAELWKTGDRLHAMEADIPIDNGRLAIEELFLGAPAIFAFGSIYSANSRNFEPLIDADGIGCKRPLQMVLVSSGSGAVPENI